MSIKTAEDFEKAVDQLILNINTDMSEAMYLQKDTLDTTAFNITLDSLEKRLNQLYTNVRTIEDLLSYSKTFIATETKRYKKEIREILNSITDSSMAIVNKDYISYNVELTESVGDYIDRDGTSLPHSNLLKEKLSAPYNVVNNYKISNVDFKSSHDLYSNNIESFKENKIYRSFYLLSNITNSITEQLTFYIKDQPKMVNFIDINPINSDIEKIELILESDGIVIVQNKSNFSPQLIKGIRLFLKSKFYNLKTFKVPINVGNKKTSILLGDISFLNEEMKTGNITRDEYNKLLKERENVVNWMYQVNEWSFKNVNNFSNYKDFYQQFINTKNNNIVLK